MRKAIAFIMTAILLCMSIIPVMAQKRTNFQPSPEPEKEYCILTVDDDFADDSILVTFNRATSRKLLDYTPEDFPEIDCVKVDDLMPYLKAELRDKVAADENQPYEKYYNLHDGKYYSELDIEFDSYYQTVCITLAHPGKMNVLDAIQILEQRDDVLNVSPNGIVYSDLSGNDDGDVSVPRGEYDNGDVNGDGKVNSRDVVALMKAIVGGITAGELPEGDINGDGKLNSRDVMLLAKLIVANIAG